MEIYIWLLAWVECPRLLFLYGRQQNYHIRHSEYVFQMSPEEYQSCFWHLPHKYFLYYYSE